MSRRFPGVELVDWRSRLIERHPCLFPDAEPKRDASGHWLCSAGWPAVEDGWRDVTERLCWRLDRIARCSAGSVAILSIDEKYAEMRVEVVGEGLSVTDNAAVADAVALAEARSGLTCGVCGERGGVWSRGGWLLARCDRHGEGLPDRERHGPTRIAYRQDGHRTVSTVRSYDYGRDIFAAVASSSET